VQRAAEAKKDDSGIVDLAAAAASDPSAPARAQSTPLASQGLFDDEPASVRPPPPSSAHAQQPIPSMPPIPASVPPVSTAMPAASTPIGPVAQAATSSQVAHLPKKKSGSGATIALLFGGLVAVSAAAAGTFFFMKHRAQQQLAAMTTTPASPPAATPTAATPDTTPAPMAAQADPTPATDDTSMQVTNGKVASRSNAMKGLAIKGATNTAAPPPAAAKEEPAKVSQADIPKTAAAGPAGSLGDEMKKAVGDSDKAGNPVPAAGPSGPQFAPGSVPTKPSQGAVTGALGAVLPAARQCLGPDDPISRAIVVFGSNGSVQSISVSGGAAGKPAEGCIKNALKGAKVAPFAEPTYTAPVTIRH
jgi:hypothetical protein